MRQWRAECAELLCVTNKTAEENKLSLAFPGSQCPNCHKKIKLYHNIPLLGFIFLAGKCAYCKQKIPLMYPALELITCTSSILVYWRFGASWQFLAALLFTYCIIALSTIDIKEQILPDAITLGTLWIGLLINSFAVFTNLQDALWSSATGYCALWLISWIFLQIRKKQGMGHGDFKMLAMIGAWFGWQLMMDSLIIAAIIGTILGILMICIKKSNWSKPIPFGPFLALGAWISMMYSGNLI